MADAGEPEGLSAEKEDGVVQQVQPHVDQTHHIPTQYKGHTLQDSVP